MTEPVAAPAIVVREVRPDEYGDLGDVLVAAYRELDPDGVVADSGYLEHIRDVAVRAAACPTLVAVDAGGTVLGGITYVPGPGTPYSETERPGEAGFRMLAVAPEARGRGVGRRLVEACIARARADGRHRLVLLTTTDMHAAHRLYERMGFRRAPERDWTAEPGIELIGYALDLA